MCFIMTLFCFVFEIFLIKHLAAILSDQIYSLLLFDSKWMNFIYFPHSFAPLVSLRISSVLNSHLLGPRWWARFHIALEYNNENMRFIRLLLANQIAYIFRSVIRDNYGDRKRILVNGEFFWVSDKLISQFKAKITNLKFAKFFSSR